MRYVAATGLLTRECAANGREGGGRNVDHPKIQVQVQTQHAVPCHVGALAHQTTARAEPTRGARSVDAYCGGGVFFVEIVGHCLLLLLCTVQVCVYSSTANRVASGERARALSLSRARTLNPHAHAGNTIMPAD